MSHTVESEQFDSRSVSHAVTKLLCSLQPRSEKLSGQTNCVRVCNGLSLMCSCLELRVAALQPRVSLFHCQVKIFQLQNVADLEEKHADVTGTLWF